MMIEVFNFKVWDTQNDTWIFHPRASTRERIARIEGTILENSGRLVDESCVDAEGQEIATS
jgi:hypothetical protein